MGEFKPAWSVRTGKRLDHLVPEAHFTHPYFRDAITDKPPTLVGGIAAETVLPETSEEEE